ncbi:cytochrome P450 [Streptomyces griseocarneus]|uniref:cytochrome P450 n=1 Tax=Streptomyces griseocarneus TaxID=51201 RepID=UPI0019A5B4B0|nr:cytochrome P450 [Streptomyces griseocarneus]MBZ6475353.1 cytochrome P450 [Streptomyces griseocarneus]GHG74766.1 cytochrome P450 [Streptomyces griseocarneus]
MPATLPLPPGPALNREELWRLEQQPSVLEEFRASYGDLFTLYRPDQPPRVFLSDPRHFRSILLRHDRELVGLGTTMYNDLIGPRSMLKLAGAEHRRIRQIVTPLLVGTSLQRRADTVHRLITQGLHDLRGCPPQPLARMTIRITARVMNSLIFPDLPQATDHAVEEALVAVLNALHNARTAAPQRRAQLDAQYRHHRTELDRLLLTEIARARTTGTGTRGSLLTALLAAPHQLPDHDIRDQLVSLLTGGTTTAANGMSMALYWLHHRPDVAERLTAELRTLPEHASTREIASLPYLSAVCMEALRVPTVTPTSAARRVVTPFTAEGFHFPEGTEITVAIHLAHHDEQAYPDHARFRPERFLGRPPDGMRYLPFGIGSHRCPGAQMTELEMRLTLAEALRLHAFGLLGADDELRPRSHGVNLTTPHSIRVHCPSA